MSTNASIQIVEVASADNIAALGGLRYGYVKKYRGLQEIYWMYVCLHKILPGGQTIEPADILGSCENICPPGSILRVITTKPLHSLTLRAHDLLHRLPSEPLFLFSPDSR